MSTYASPIPGLPDYGGQMVQIQNAYDKAKINLNNKRSTYLRGAGYMLDPSGKLTVDPNNQYGGLQQMFRGLAQGQEGLDEQQTARGFADSGMAGQAAHDLQYQQGVQQQGFAGNVQNEEDQYSNDMYSAGADYNTNLYNVQQNALQAALSDPNNFNPGHHTADVPYGGTGPTTPPPDPGGPGVHGKIQWGGQMLDSRGMKLWLQNHGQNVQAWARNHPGAAKQLGL